MASAAVVLGTGRILARIPQPIDGIEATMADLPCDNHPTEAAMLLITSLDGSGTLTLCMDCVEIWTKAVSGEFDYARAEIGLPAQPAEEAETPEPAEPEPDSEPKRAETEETQAREPEADLQTPAQETTATSQ